MCTWWLWWLLGVEAPLLGVWGVPPPASVTSGSSRMMNRPFFSLAPTVLPDLLKESVRSETALMSPVPNRCGGCGCGWAAEEEDGWWWWSGPLIRPPRMSPSGYEASSASAASTCFTRKRPFRSGTALLLVLLSPPPPPPPALAVLASDMRVVAWTGRGQRCGGPLASSVGCLLPSSPVEWWWWV